MSTMKKLFALTLALAMLMSVAAFAGFTDTATIDKKCVEDVQLLTAMGIIEGNADGSFGPKNTIKRSEAAAMIYRLRNGGEDDKAEAWKGASSFTDVADDIWYSGYVAYCENFGIIDGKSATIFDPNAPVTTPELAKMLLVVAGYKSDVEGYTGSNWAKNVLADATDAGLFADFGGSYAGACSREWACKLMVNAIEVETAVYLGDYLLPGGAETVGAKYLDIAGATKAIVIANDTWSVVEGGVLGAQTSSEGFPYKPYTSERKLAAEGKIIVAPMEGIKEYKAGNITTAEFYSDWTLEIEAADDSIVGQEIKIVIKNDDSVLGYTTTGASVSGALTITKGTKNSATVYTVKVGGTTYVDQKAGTTVFTTAAYDAVTNNGYYGNMLTSGSGVFVSRTAAGLVDWNLMFPAMALTSVEGYYNNIYNLNREAEYIAYDFDGDKTIDTVISMTPVFSIYRADTSDGGKTFGFFMGPNYETDKCGGYHTSGSYWTKNITYVGGMTKNEVYRITSDYTKGGATTEKVDGTIAKLEQINYNTDGTIAKVIIGGVEYTFATTGLKMYGGGRLARGNNALTTTSTSHLAPVVEWESLLGKLVKVYADKNGNLVRVDAYTPSTGTTTTTPSTIDKSKLAYLIASQDVTVSSTSTDEWGNVSNTPVVVKKVKVMFADGTSAIMTYDNDSKLTGAAKASALVTGKVYEYAVNADGEIVLFTNLSKATNVYYGAATTAGTAAAASLSNEVTYSLAKNRFGDILVDDNTLIFVKYTTKVSNVDTVVYKVMKISEFKKGIDGAKFQLIARNSSAISTALVASIDFGANDLPVDPAAPAEPAGSYLIYATSAAVKFNLGEDKDGNPINVAKFTAVDLNTGVSGEYYVADVNASVTKGAIYAGTFNEDGYLATVPAATTVAEFAGSLTASSWLKGKVVAKSGDIILVDSTLIDKDNLAEKYVVLEKSGTDFEVSDYASISTVAKDQDNNIVIKTDAEGKIVMIIYTADGKAF